MNNDKIKFNEQNLEENNLLNILFNTDIINDRKTKIISRNNYLLLIKLIKSIEDIELFNFFNYLNKINIQILKIIVNGFIEFDFNDEKEGKMILTIISKIIRIYFNKNIFYFIYKKLSKYFRRHYKLKDIQAIKKFEKLFKVWKLLYNIDMFCDDIKENNNINPGIIFYSQINNKNKNITIDFERNSLANNKCLLIKIEFFRSPILNINKIIENFSFLKLYDKNSNEFEFTYNHIFNKNTFIKDSFSKIDTISFELSDEIYEIHINDKRFSNKENFNFNSIIKIEILNNFLGEVSKITIEKDNLINIYIKNTFTGVKCDINYLNENENEENIHKLDDIILIQYKGEIFSKKYKNNSNNIICNKSLKSLKDLEYFGGFESFIPLFKIIKYIINELGNIFNININDTGKENNHNYIIELIKAIEWINDILKIIIQLNFVCKSNYLNFKKNIVSLIGALSEIYNIFNRLSLNKIKNLFINDGIIKDLFIIICNTKVSKNIIITYQKIFDINNKIFENYNISMNYILFQENNKIIDFYWYFEMAFNFVLFILLYSNSRAKVPKLIIGQLDKIYSYTTLNFQNLDKEVARTFLIGAKPFLNILNGNKKLLQIFNNYHYLFNENNFYFIFIIKIIATYLNVKKLLEINNINYKGYKYIKGINELFKYFELEYNTMNINIEKEKEIKEYFKIYIKDFDILHKIFPFLKIEDFYDRNECLKYELIDFNGKYHHLIKELFIFNRLWSNKKIFYESSLDERKKSNLKYKNINYYTTNFQRPFIYPVLDYKYRYPEFSRFKKLKDLYKKDENQDDYNFDLDISELENILYSYNNEIINEMKDNKEIKNYCICLIKQEYHIKGNLFVLHGKNNLNLIFYSNPEALDGNNIIQNCNNSIKTENKNEKNKNNFCNGAIFKCSLKEKHKKIVINLEDIRLILKRIYYYRKSAFEIFTKTKSYYFNFHSENDLNDFMNIIKIYFENSYFHITINNKLNGYFRLNNNFVNKSNNNEFSRFICKLAFESSKICIFDLILLINLISNRSFIDLTQYPVFPLLYFYNKSNIIKVRDLTQHIGFQEFSDESKKRKNLFINSFKGLVEEKESNLEINYFNTHYSNIIYTSNYMVRLFPYSFCAIELQGDGFDDPNRLFNSIISSFYNISTQKSDLRELIPEFFYLPEMFININCLNFSTKSNNELVDDVKVPKILDNIFDLKDDEDEMEIKDNCLNIFMFVDDMKKRLEKSKKNIFSWLKLIFGEEQRYKLNKKGDVKEQYFRKESYIDIDQSIYKMYSEDGITMSSVDFGLIPLKTIFDNKINCNINIKHTHENKIENEINNKKNKKMSSNDILINIKKSSKRNTKTFNDIYKYEEHKINNLYFNDDYKLEFKLVDNFQKLKIYENEKFIIDIIDHNEQIIDLFYNSRLNIFATTSYDSFVYIYLFPKKLISIIKHPKNQYFDKIYISANPFPTIITFEKQNNLLSSYSLSGILIKQKKLPDNNQLNINLFFDINGGTSIIDRIQINLNGKEISFTLPFFDEDQI